MVSNETEFIRSLRVVLTHLVKHVEPVPEPFLSIGLAHERGEWKNFSAEKKYALVRQLQEEITGSDRVSKHYATYPHQYSVDRFTVLCEHLAQFAASLKESF